MNMWDNNSDECINVWSLNSPFFHDKIIFLQVSIGTILVTLPRYIVGNWSQRADEQRKRYKQIVMSHELNNTLIVIHTMYIFVAFLEIIRKLLANNIRTANVPTFRILLIGRYSHLAIKAILCESKQEKKNKIL